MTTEKQLEKLENLGIQAKNTLFKMHSVNTSDFLRPIQGDSHKQNQYTLANEETLTAQKNQLLDLFGYGNYTFKKISENLLKEIDDAFSLMLKLAYQEKYYYLLAEKELHIQYIKPAINENIIPHEAYHEKNYLEDLKAQHNKLYDLLINRNFGYYSYYIFENKRIWYYFFLNEKNKDIFSKKFVSYSEAISDLKMAFPPKLKLNYTSEVVAFDSELSNMEKLAYLNESGILKYLTKLNSTNKVAKLLMKFVDFKTAKVDTVERYIKICLNEPYHYQYPKNIDKINEYLQEIKFRKE
ncbi:hypothetical protein ACU8DI_13000 [Psychroserpens sp. BH13MA-6]